MKEHGAPLRGCTPLEGERQGQASVQPVHVPGALRTRPTRFPSESHPPRGPPAATVAGAQIGPCCSLPLPASSPSLLPRPPLPRSSEVTSSERTPRTRRVPGPHPLGSSDALSAWQCPSTALITAWHRGLAIACLPCPTAEWASCSVPASGMARRAGVWARRWEAQTLPWGLVTWVLAGSWEPAPPAHCAEHLSCSPGFLPPRPPGLLCSWSPHLAGELSGNDGRGLRADGAGEKPSTWAAEGEAEPEKSPLACLWVRGCRSPSRGDRAEAGAPRGKPGCGDRCGGGGASSQTHSCWGRSGRTVGSGGLHLLSPRGVKRGHGAPGQGCGGPPGSDLVLVSQCC